jgi:hypothetical protein
MAKQLQETKSVRQEEPQTTIASIRLQQQEMISMMSLLCQVVCVIAANDPRLSSDPRIQTILTSVVATNFGLARDESPADNSIETPRTPQGDWTTVGPKNSKNSKNSQIKPSSLQAASQLLEAAPTQQVPDHASAAPTTPPKRQSNTSPTVARHSNTQVPSPTNGTPKKLPSMTMNDQDNPSQHGTDHGTDLLHRSDRSTLQHNDKPDAHPFHPPLQNATANKMRTDMSDDEVCHNEDDDNDDDDDDGDDCDASCHSDGSDASDTIMDTTTNPNNKDRPTPTPDGFLKRPTRRHSINLLSKAYLAKEPKKLPPVKASTARKLKTPPTIGKTVANSGKKTR